MGGCFLCARFPCSPPASSCVSSTRVSILLSECPISERPTLCHCIFPKDAVPTPCNEQNPIITAYSVNNKQTLPRIRASAHNERNPSPTTVHTQPLSPVNTCVLFDPPTPRAPTPPFLGEQTLSLYPQYSRGKVILLIQVYLNHKKQPPPRTLQQDHA